MKKTLAMLFVLLLLGIAALAEPMSPLDYTDDILEDGSPIYYFQELSLKLPASWRGRVMALPGERGVGFYQVASYEKYRAEGLDGGGFLFSLGASVNSSFSQLPAGLYSYYVGDTLVDMVRLMDSTGQSTVSYTAKYIHGDGDATLAALDAAIRNFRAE